MVIAQAEAQRLENELAALQVALEEALQSAKEEAEIANLRANIAEAEARAAQAKADVAEAERDKARAEQQIKENELKAEKELLELQLALAKTQATFETELKKIEDAAKRAELLRVVDKYNEAIENLQKAEKNLYTTQNDLIRYKNGMISDSLAIQIYIAEYQNEISENENLSNRAISKIDALKKYQSSTSSTAELEATLINLQNELFDKKQAADKANYAANDALNKANDYYKQNIYFNPKEYLIDLEWPAIIDYADETSTSYVDKNGETHYIKSKLCKYLSNAVVDIYGTPNQLKLTYKENNTTKYFYIGDNGYSLWVLINKPTGFDKSVAKNTYEIEKAEINQLLAADKANLHKYDSIAKVLGDSVNVLEKVYAKDPSAKIGGKEVKVIITELTADMTNYRNSAISLQENIDKRNVELKDLDKLYDTCVNFDKLAAEVQKKTDSYNTDALNCYKNYIALLQEYYDLDKAADDLNFEVKAITSKLYNSEDIDDEISELQNDILSYENKIVLFEAEIKDLQTLNINDYNLIALYEKMIEGYKAEVELWKKEVEAAKEELDAAVKGAVQNNAGTTETE